MRYVVAIMTTAMTNICSAKPVCSPRMKKPVQDEAQAWEQQTCLGSAGLGLEACVARFFSSSTDTSRSFSLPMPSSTVAPAGMTWRD